MPRRLTYWAVLCLLLVPQGARAGGFVVARFGGEHGHAASDHPTAIYYNPAGLALGSGWRIYAEGVFGLRNLSYDRPAEAIGKVVEPGDNEAGTPRDAIGANSGEATLTNFLASPFLGAVTDFGIPNLAVGVAAYVPFGGQASWDKNDDFEGNTAYPGAEDGVQRWSTIKGSLRSLYVTLAGAYRLPGPRLSFGVGLNAISSSIDTIRARTAAGSDDLVGPDGRLLEGRSLIETSSFDFSASVGVTWQPIDQLTVGLSYQAQPGFGKTTQSGTLTNKLGLADVSVGDIDLEQELPDIYRVAVRYQATPKVELRLSGDVQRWSVFKNQCLLDANDASADCDLTADGGPGADASGVVVNIPRRWDNTFGVRMGLSYWFSPEFELNGGAVFETSAVPDETVDAALIDMNKVIALAGVRYAVMSGKLLLGLTLNNVFYFDRTVAPRERDADGNQQGPRAPSAIPDGAGTYKQNIFFVNAGGEYRF